MIRVAVVLLLVCGLVVLGCDDTRHPDTLTSAPSAGSPLSLQRITDLTLLGFSVHYNGRTYNSAANTTTFSYTVTGTGNTIHFRVQLPTCAPANPTFSPTPSASNNNDAYIMPGVTWSPPTGAPAPPSGFTATVTYPGDVAEGIISVSIKTVSNQVAVGEIAGACAGLFDISGKVFADSLANGVFDSPDRGLSNVTVRLYDAAGGYLDQAASDTDGNYTFTGHAGGFYTVSADSTTLPSTKFLSTTPLNQSVTIGPNSTNNNFGFAPLFDISGGVFTDENADGAWNATELGISSVTVRLRDASDALLATLATNSAGGYLFANYLRGTYSVTVDSATLPQTGKYLSATTTKTRTVWIGPDSPGNDFGFQPKTGQIINDLKFGTLATTGKSANWWKGELQTAVTGNGKANVPRDSLIAYIQRIRQLALTAPYADLLGTGNGLQEAFNLLSRPTQTDLAKLMRELLATEFNHVAHRGTDPALQLILIGWGETIAVNDPGYTTNSPFVRSTTSDGGILPMGATGITLDASKVFVGLNSGGGGGGTE